MVIPKRTSGHPTLTAVHRRTRTAVALGLCLTLVAGGAGCSDKSGEDAAEAGSSTTTSAGPALEGDAAFAFELCSTLTGWVNQITAATQELNDAVQGNNPATRPYDTWGEEVTAATDDLEPRLAAVTYPDTPQGQAIREAVLAGAAEAEARIDEVVGQIDALLEEFPDSHSRVGTLLVRTEKALHDPEPPVEADGTALDDALLAEPECKHVTEP
jgi:hypothetical protein